MGLKEKAQPGDSHQPVGQINGEILVSSHLGPSCVR